MILVLYAGLLIWQILWLVLAIRKRKGWIRLLILSVACTALAVFGTWYFNEMPGLGIMPGLAFFQEFFYSLIASVIYFVMTLVALLGALVQKK